MKSEFNWKDLVLVLVTVLVGGAGWTQDSQAVIVTALAVGIVWALGFLAKQFGLSPGKAALTAVLFVISLILAPLFSPVALPAFPAWSGDLAGWFPLFLVYLGELITIAGPVVAYATGIYNILLAKVMEKLSVRVQGLLPEK